MTSNQERAEVILRVTGLTPQGHIYQFDARVELPPDLQTIQMVQVIEPRHNLILAYGSAIPADFRQAPPKRRRPEAAE